MKRIYSALWCLSLLLFQTESNSEAYQIAGMYTQHYRDGTYAEWGKYSRIGAKLALEYINKSSLIWPDTIEMHPENIIDYHCSSENVALMVKSLMEKDIIAITGAECSNPAVVMANSGSQFKVPVISYGANAAELSSSLIYPWFVRVVSPSETYEKYLIDLAAFFNIRKIAFIHTSDAWGRGASRVIDEAAKKFNIEVLKKFSFSRDSSQTEIDKILEIIKTNNIKHIFITAPTPDTVKFFRSVNTFDLNKKGYSFYASELILSDTPDDVISGAAGYFAPIAGLSISPELNEYIKNYESFTGETADLNSGNFIYSVLSYDHIILIANAINLLKLNDLDVSGENIIDYIRQVDFIGASGRISYKNGSNDREFAPIKIMNFHGKNKDGKMVFKPVAQTDKRTGELKIFGENIIWPGGSKIAPE